VVSLAHRGLVTIELLFQLDSIGFAWNMPRFTLNVDTRANVIRSTIFRIFFTLISVLVSSKFHKLLDSSPWLLLPDTSIINAYQNAINKKFPIIDVRTMLYIICWYIPYLTLQQQPSYKYTLLHTHICGFHRFIAKTRLQPTSRFHSTMAFVQLVAQVP